MGTGARGSVVGVTVWPVKSMAGGTSVRQACAQPRGLVGDREFAVLDRRPLRDGRPLSARNQPGLLRWHAGRDGDGLPDVVAPDGSTYRWDDPELPTALSSALGVPVGVSPRGGYSDLASSVLVTTTATHAAVERAVGRPLDGGRWRTNLTLDLDSEPFAESTWEGGTLQVGDVVLRLLHPCRRCTIPTWQPDGSERTPDVLLWLLEHNAQVFGINARVEQAGDVHVGDDVSVRGPFTPGSRPRRTRA